MNSIPGVRSTDQFIALDRRVFEDCIDRALAASNEAPGRGGETDEEAAERIVAEYRDDRTSIALAAIAWARANPR